MSHSDSEINDDIKERIKKPLHFEFKAKRRITLRRGCADVRALRKRLQPIYQEISLVQAVNLHNTEEVKRLLECGTSPNSTDTDMRSALHVAVSKGYADIVGLLLKHGADPNKRDLIQNTPLHLAACEHNFSIISMLIDAKADVSCLDIHGRNPFQLASSKLQILQKGWRSGAIEMFKLRKELQQVVNLLLSILTRQIEEKMEKMNRSDIDDLQLTKLSLDSRPAEELDDQMCKLLNDIEKFKIT